MEPLDINSESQSLTQREAQEMAAGALRVDGVHFFLAEGGRRCFLGVTG